MAADRAVTLRQTVGFCTARDGTRIATAKVGSGPPLVRAAHWLSHVENDPASPVWGPWLRELSRDRTYIRYDQRGSGLSDRHVEDLSLDAWVGDLESVVDQFGLARFPVFGMSQGGAVAIDYAVRHPEKVTRLVFLGAYARGALARARTDADRLEAETLVNAIRVGWGGESRAFRQLFTHRFIPDGTPEQMRWWTELQRSTASADVAERTLRAFQHVDVSALARRVRVPALVFHARGDVAVPYEEGLHLASLIPGARFVSLETDNHVLLESEPAWQVFLAELRAFLREDAPEASAEEGELTSAEREVLGHLARGLDNRAIAEALGKSEKTVRNQVSSVFAKLGVRTRAEAIVRVRDRAGG